MQRRVERALVAKVGAVVFAAALGLPVTLSPASARASVMVASAVEGALPPVSVTAVAVDLLDLPELHLPRTSSGLAVASTLMVDDLDGVAAAPAPPAGEPPAAATAPPAPTVVLAAVATPAPPPPTQPPPEPLILDGVVVASWYGPGFYGNRTACGQTYTPEIVGVAHRLLPCGTPIEITSPAGVSVVVPVIDRGPYVAGRTLDLSNATKIALRCSDLCHVRMTVVK